MKVISQLIFLAQFFYYSVDKFSRNSFLRLFLPTNHPQTHLGVMTKEKTGIDKLFVVIVIVATLPGRFGSTVLHKVGMRDLVCYLIIQPGEKIAESNSPT